VFPLQRSDFHQRAFRVTESVDPTLLCATVREQGETAHFTNSLEPILGDQEAKVPSAVEDSVDLMERLWRVRRESLRSGAALVTIGHAEADKSTLFAEFDAICRREEMATVFADEVNLLFREESEIHDLLDQALRDE
jgi:hypothetical protein